MHNQRTNQVANNRKLPQTVLAYPSASLVSIQMICLGPIGINTIILLLIRCFFFLEKVYTSLKLLQLNPHELKSHEVVCVDQIRCNQLIFFQLPFTILQDLISTHRSNLRIPKRPFVVVLSTFS